MNPGFRFSALPVSRSCAVIAALTLGSSASARSTHGSAATPTSGGNVVDRTTQDSTSR